MNADAIKLAVIGGSGFNTFEALEDPRTIRTSTPFGDAAPITVGSLSGVELAFMPRHGPGHNLPPHRINYRANMWALRELRAERILAVNAVGGIREDMIAGRLVCPHQIVDYTWGRDHTFFDDEVAYTEFERPYDESWRRLLLTIARENGLDLVADGVYGCTQGPRLESAAEIRRLKNDGCDLVGMTGMPETVLARELALSYAAIGVVVNRAAGLSASPITLELIYRQLTVSINDVKEFIGVLVSALATEAPESR